MKERIQEVYRIQYLNKRILEISIRENREEEINKEIILKVS